MDLELENKGIEKELNQYMPYVHSNDMPIYAIFRCGRKYHSIAQIKGFMKHMERLQDTPNADESKRADNRIIYGPEDVYEDTKEYLKDCKIYKNSVVGIELLLTCSPSFFKGLSPVEFEKWIDVNRRWLVQEFHENVRYAVLHLDETT
jgi:hypothetical protein